MRRCSVHPKRVHAAKFSVIAHKDALMYACGSQRYSLAAAISAGSAAPHALVKEVRLLWVFEDIANTACRSDSCALLCYSLDLPKESIYDYKPIGDPASGNLDCLRVHTWCYHWQSSLLPIMWYSVLGRVVELTTMSATIASHTLAKHNERPHDVVKRHPSVRISLVLEARLALSVDFVHERCAAGSANWLVI
eukprot:SAG31_NODE_56_length_29726_cov_41.443312_14_plen_193_part_00